MVIDLEYKVQSKLTGQERFPKEGVQSLIKMKIYPDNVCVHIYLPVYCRSSRNSSNGNGVNLGRIAQ